MAPLLIAALLSFYPPELAGWYEACSRGDWTLAEAEALELARSDSTSDIAAPALMIALGLSGDGEAFENTVWSKTPGTIERTAMAVSLMQGSGSFTDDARGQISEALALDPENTLAWYLAGRMELPMRPARAESCFNSVIALDPGFLPARLELARLERDGGDHPAALGEFLRIWETGTPAGELALAELVLLADSLQYPQRADSARVILESEAPSAWERLALEQAGTRPALAMRAVEAGSSRPTEVLGSVSMQLGDYSGAALIFRELLAGEEADSAAVLPLLGMSLYMLGNDGEAGQVFVAALEKDPLSVTSIVHLGLISERAGETGPAVDRYLSALELDVFEPVARERLRAIADDSYDPEELAGSSAGLSITAGADLSLEKGNRTLLEWGGSASLSYRFDRRGTSVDGSLGGRSVTWEEYSGLGTDTLNTNRGWATLSFDYWFSDQWYVQVSSGWDRQMYTERPWQISSSCALGWQKRIMSWFRFSPRLGVGSVNARWTTGRREFHTDDFSVFGAAALSYDKPHTFIRRAEISGEVYFPPDSPENFMSGGQVSLSFRTWTPLYLSIGYEVDYTRSPEVSTWSKFNTSFVTAVSLDLY